MIFDQTCKTNDSNSTLPYNKTDTRDGDDEVAPYYYVDDTHLSGNNDENVNSNEREDAPKKKYVGDKAVVGFVPSHLQVRRGAKKKISKKKN